MCSEAPLGFQKEPVEEVRFVHYLKFGVWITFFVVWLFLLNGFLIPRFAFRMEQRHYSRMGQHCICLEMDLRYIRFEMDQRYAHLDLKLPPSLIVDHTFAIVIHFIWGGPMFHTRVDQRSLPG
jgi:hypothetical protein